MRSVNQAGARKKTARVTAEETAVGEAEGSLVQSSGTSNKHHKRKFNPEDRVPSAGPETTRVNMKLNKSDLR